MIENTARNRMGTSISRGASFAFFEVDVSLLTAMAWIIRKQYAAEKTKFRIIKKEREGMPASMPALMIVSSLQKMFKGGILAKDKVPIMNAAPVMGIARLTPASSSKLRVLVPCMKAPAHRKSKALTRA